MEKGGPVDVVAEGGEREIVEDADAGEGGDGEVFGAPDDGGVAGTGGGERDDLLLGGGVLAAQGLVGGVVLGDEGGAELVGKEAGGDGNGAAGVQHVNDGMAIVRGDFDGGVGAAGGGAADEQGQGEALTLHFAGYMDHLVERGGDEAG